MSMFRRLAKDADKLVGNGRRGLSHGHPRRSSAKTGQTRGGVKTDQYRLLVRSF